MAEARMLPGPPQLDPKLNFFSASFDAGLALRTPWLQPPNPRVRPLQMLQQCRFILPPDMEESLAEKQFQNRPAEDVEAAKARSGPARVRREAAELRQSAVHRIAQAVAAGPLQLLRRCFEGGTRVRVVTRHAHGVRGSCTGLLKAFDKRMNLVLQDVEEQYTVRLKITRSKMALKQVFGEPSAKNAGAGTDETSPTYVSVEKIRTAFKQEHRSRQLKQIFVRGSNVVLINVVKDFQRQKND